MWQIYRFRQLFVNSSTMMSLSVFLYVLFAKSTEFTVMSAAVASSNFDLEEMSVPRFPRINGDKVENITLASDETITSLVCEYQGTPTPQLIWLIDSKSLPQSYEVVTDVQHGKSILQIPKTEGFDKQTNISCVAANFLGRALKTFLIFQQQQPVDYDNGGEYQYETSPTSKHRWI